MDTTATISASVITHPTAREILLWAIGQVVAVAPIIVIYIIFIPKKLKMRKKLKWYKPLLEGDLFIFSTSLASFSNISVVIKNPGLLMNDYLLAYFIVLCVILFLNTLFVYEDARGKIADWYGKEYDELFGDKITLIAQICLAVLTLLFSFLLFYNGAY